MNFLRRYYRSLNSTQKVSDIICRKYRKTPKVWSKSKEVFSHSFDDFKWQNDSSSIQSGGFAENIGWAKKSNFVNISYSDRLFGPPCIFYKAVIQL